MKRATTQQDIFPPFCWFRVTGPAKANFIISELNQNLFNFLFLKKCSAVSLRLNLNSQK